MTAKAEDRRVQRTRALLLSALLDLIVEQGYEEITVQDIVDRANVGRSTFYAHFLDKRELLLTGVDGLQELLIQQGEAPDTSAAPQRAPAAVQPATVAARAEQLTFLPGAARHPQRGDCGAAHPGHPGRSGARGACCLRPARCGAGGSARRSRAVYG